MQTEPLIKRTVVFVDGQNLYHGAREAFGYSYPNYDISALAQTLCSVRGWMLLQTRFYTGVADQMRAIRSGGTNSGAPNCLP